MQLAEKYRPTRIEDVAGHERVKKALARIFATSGVGGRAFWFSGPSGSGKTTLARIVAREIADPDFPGNVQEIDAGAVGPAVIREIEDSLVTCAMGRKQGRAVIVNEAHGLRADAIRQLLVTLERIPDHAVWVFTTTAAGEVDLFESKIDAGPLRSRCIPFDLGTDRGTNAVFAARAMDIARAEGLDGSGLDAYKMAVARSRGNLRAVLQAVEAGEFVAER